MLATKPILTICEESGGRFCTEDMEKITEEVRGAAQKIITAKKATYYGIGMALVRITRAIFGNESSVLTVSAMLRGEYGQSNVFVGAPCIVGRNGIQRTLTLSLNDQELEQFRTSCDTLREFYDGCRSVESSKKTRRSVCGTALFFKHGCFFCIAKPDGSPQKRLHPVLLPFLPHRNHFRVPRARFTPQPGWDYYISHPGPEPSPGRYTPRPPEFPDADGDPPAFHRGCPSGDRFPDSQSPYRPL